MTDNQSVRYLAEGAIAILMLNRPDKKNALNAEMIAELKSGLRRAGADETVRAILITGAGSDFCSGADLSALKTIAQGSVSDNVADARSLMELFNLFREIQVPVIAAVKGRALAGGCGLASACDLVLASESARFGYPEVKIGFVPAMVMAILRRNISEKRAFELLTQGAEIGAEEAKDIGLVNQLFPDDQFDEAAVTYARRFEKLSKSAVTLTKALLYQSDGMAFRDALETGVDVNVIARMTQDLRNGITRFLAKEN